MKIHKDQILNYIPQRPPFIMINHLLEADPNFFKSEFCIEEGNIFLKNGFLTPYGMIENIAQTATAGIALSQINKRTFKDGFLASISNLEAIKLPQKNEHILTIVELLYNFENMFRIQGNCYNLNNDLLLSAKMTLAAQY